jgi:hypothetical protein
MDSSIWGGCGSDELGARQMPWEMEVSCTGMRSRCVSKSPRDLERVFGGLAIFVVFESEEGGVRWSY